MQVLNQEKVSRESSLRSYRKLYDFYLSQLPEGLTEEERGDVLKRLLRSHGGAVLHIFVIYEKEYALGENLSGLIEYSHRQDYLFCLEGHWQGILWIFVQN
ncbi:MAG TPA: hypothetical protein VJJ21_03445 [Candidatus Nanoarchaeia archaeon]|nr:hypothetical protein [Candidatus Nanoarchaeia archaeon]